MSASATQTNAVTLGKGTLLSRILGFLRDAMIAALVGGGGMADALLLALRIPNTARALLADGAFAYTIIPVYQEYRHLGSEKAWWLVRSLTAALFLLFSITAVVGFVLSKPLVFFLAPGFADTPQTLNLTASFLGLGLLSLPLVAGAAVSASALMAEGRFHAPAYSGALFNCIIIATVGLAIFFLAPGSPQAPYIVCWSFIIGGAIQWMYQYLYLSRIGFSFRGQTSIRSAEITSLLRALPASIFAVGGHQANLLAATVIASFLAEGSVSALYFAERLLRFPLGVIGVSLGLAALSDLTALGFPEKDPATRKEFHTRLVKAGRLTLFFALPAAVGAACLASPLTDILFGRGEFGTDALLRTIQALLAYMLGLPALALTRPLLAGAGSLRDTATPKRAALLALGGTVVFGFLLLPFGVSWGPALAVSLGAFVNAGVLSIRLARIGFYPLPSRSWTVRTMIANAFMACCVLGCASLVDSTVIKVACVPLGVLVYFGMTHCLRLEESAIALELLKRILSRKRG